MARRKYKSDTVFERVEDANVEPEPPSDPSPFDEEQAQNDEPSSLEERPVVEPSPAEPEIPEAAEIPPLPDVPERGWLLEQGRSEQEADAIIKHLSALHDELTAINAPPKPTKLVPAFRLFSKRPGGFWVAGRQVKTGSALEIPIEQLDESQLREIETVKERYISVEEIELEVEIDDEQ